MKRSEINNQIDFSINLLKENKFYLPQWAYLSPAEWKEKASKPEYNEIIISQMGWDVTEFSKNDFKNIGLTAFTIRNGYATRTPFKPYCEKIMIVGVNQKTPMHFHWKKMEDIINRGGGDLCIELWKADKTTEEKTTEDIEILIDGVRNKFKAGTVLKLKPGDSICFEPYIYHEFWAEGQTALIGEVSTVNDDTNDNRFYEPLGRFPAIVEDEPMRYCLCNEYGK